MLTVTFYSYKGGVGRTMALLNVAARLVALGKKVVLLDLDLEAPGLGHAETTRPPTEDGQPVPGASDFVFDHLANKALPLSSYMYTVALWQGEAHVIGAGTRAAELSRKVARIVAEKDDMVPGSAGIFEHLLAKIEEELAPDYLLIDSRTGRADIAGVCTMELPEVIVACCGLSEQNVTGMGDALDTIWKYHDEAGLSVLTLLALGPVPPNPKKTEDSPQNNLTTLGRVEAASAPLQAVRASSLLAEAPEGKEFFRRIQQLKVRVISKIQERWPKVHPYFPDTVPADVTHEIPYDAWVIFQDELVNAPESSLHRAYDLLTDSLRRAVGDEDVTQKGQTQEGSTSVEEANWLLARTDLFLNKSAR